MTKSITQGMKSLAHIHWLLRHDLNNYTVEQYECICTAIQQTHLFKQGSPNVNIYHINIAAEFLHYRILTSIHNRYR